MTIDNSKKPFYITTPIYYPSGNFHLGHTYTTIVADTLKKFKKIQGYDAYLVTGSDEHGQKLMEAARDAGMETMDYIDEIVDDAKKLWETLEIDYDTFVRSTDPQHEKNVQNIFQKLYDSGNIYKGTYKGYYCTPCESFWTESQLVDGKCPDCGREVQYKEEESYFFKLSAYQDRLIEYYEAHPDFVQPESSRNEMMSFLKAGLDDLSVSRTSFDWGIKVPFDEDHIIYVWIDALFCYFTGIGYGVDQGKFDHYWPASVHLMSKEIVRFHTIIWPALLMALGEELPDKVFAHGWILFNNDKMSKSKGNVVYAEPLIDLYGVDALKYFVLREFTFGHDGSFSIDRFLQRYNSDLANDLGNLVSRTCAMVEKYRGGILPDPGEEEGPDKDLKEALISTAKKVEDLVDDFNFSQALEEIWISIRRSNKYIDETEPWILAKEEGSKRLDTVLYNLVESIRIIGQLIEPFMGKTAEKIFQQIGIENQGWESARKFGLARNPQVKKGQALFQRLDIDEEREIWDQKNYELVQERNRQLKNKNKEKKEEERISMDDFSKVKLKIGKIVDCKNHPNADKLLVLTVDLGDEERTIVSGIKTWYEPKDLIGEKVVLCVNLKPVNLRGIESDGMILAAENGDDLTLLTPLNDIDEGSEIR